MVSLLAPSRELFCHYHQSFRHLLRLRVTRDPSVMSKEDVLRLFSTAALTSSGRPKMVDESEVELKYVENINIETTHKEKIFYNHSVVLTNMRVLVIPAHQVVGEEKCCRVLHLRHITKFHDNASYFKSSRRITATIVDGLQFHIRFNGNGKDSTLGLLTEALARKSWESVKVKSSSTSTPKEASGSTFSVLNAGVSGLKRRQEEEHKAVDMMTTDALSDLDSLMARAGEVVAVIKRYSAFRFDKPDDESETSSVVAEASEMESILQDIGIISPVTKLSAGRQYYHLLARQVADLLYDQNRITRLGGVVSLTDLYCLYNRARGTELVSPDDLLHAVRLMDSLQLGLKLRTFSSGIMVLQENSLSDEAMCNKLLEFAVQNSDEGISPSMVSTKFHLSILVAKEQLLFAESSEVLCRDDTVNGVFFFHNAFTVY